LPASGGLFLDERVEFIPRLRDFSTALMAIPGSAIYARAPHDRHTQARRLQSWGLLEREGRYYYLHEKTLNSLIGIPSYQQVRRVLE
jgi:hypothetical protein